MLYEKPWMGILKIEIEDVIRTSVTVNGNHDFDNPSDVYDDNLEDW